MEYEEILISLYASYHLYFPSKNHFRGVRIPVIFEDEVNFTIQVLQLQLALYTQTTPFSFWYSVKT